MSHDYHTYVLSAIMTAVELRSHVARNPLRPLSTPASSLYRLSTVAETYRETDPADWCNSNALDLYSTGTFFVSHHFSESLLAYVAIVPEIIHLLPNPYTPPIYLPFSFDITSPVETALSSNTSQ